MASPQTRSHVTLWDPIVRITHWGSAGIVLTNALVTKGGSVPHVYLGWGLMALLLLRLVWGGLGPHEARFSAFPPNPVAALRHLRDLVAGRVREYPSHNPAGALMVYAFWAMLALVVVTCHGIFPPPATRVRPKEGTDNEANDTNRRADHRHSAGA